LSALKPLCLLRDHTKNGVFDVGIQNPGHRA
jgi:hypothetical protein